MNIGKREIAIGVGAALLVYFMWPKESKAAVASVTSALPGGGLDADALRTMFAGSVLVPLSLIAPPVPGAKQFGVASGADPEILGSNSALALLKTAQRQANVIATPNILSDAGDNLKDRRVVIMPAGAAKPAGFVVLPTL